MNFLVAICLLLFFQVLAHTQTTAFNYQGRLTDGGNAANGTFQMKFKLFDSLGGAGQIGSTLSNVPVTVTNGVFSTKLDFGANALSGANRWLEVAVRRNASESYVTLAPREQIASSPYAVRTFSASVADNALQLGGINASEYLTNTTLGNTVIRNQAALQTPANFNISGNGIVGGNFGIGTTANQAKFSVSANSAGAGNNTAFFQAPLIGPNVSNIHFGTLGDWCIRSAHSSGKIILQDTGGYVGIGTANPISALTVQTSFPSYGFLHTGGNVTVGSFVDSGYGWFGTRSNHPLSFFTNNGLQQMTIATNGNVGIGTTNPASGRELRGTGLLTQQRITDNTSGNSLVLQAGADNNTKITGYNYNTNQAVPLYLSVDGASTNIGGNLTQSRSAGGSVKAMVYINGDGTILRCYNGITGASSGNCGFASGRGFGQGSQGVYFVNFPFQVSDRFISLSVISSCCYTPVTANFEYFDNNQLWIMVYKSNTTGQLTDRPVMLIVY